MAELVHRDYTATLRANFRSATQPIGNNLHATGSGLYDQLMSSAALAKNHLLPK